MPVGNQLNGKIEAALQDAVHAELYAAHLYRHLAAHMQRVGYRGAAAWFRHEAGDELEHYQRHVDYLNDRGAVADAPLLDAIDARPADLRTAIELAYNTELGLQDDYAAWHTDAAGDPVTQQHLLQFLDIQRRSVGEYGDLIARLDRADGDACGLLIIDQELAAKAGG